MNVSRNNLVGVYGNTPSDRSEVFGDMAMIMLWRLGRIAIRSYTPSSSYWRFLREVGSAE
ncbi:MAG: hypothetical protein ACI30V_07260 [Muribaculaceae bacterium]